MLVDSGPPIFMWGELMMTVSYLCNRIPQSVLKVETPYRIPYGKDAALLHL